MPRGGRLVIYPVLGLVYMLASVVGVVLALAIVLAIVRDRRRYAAGRARRHLDRVRDHLRALGPRPEVAEAIAELEEADRSLDLEDNSGARGA